MMKWMFAGMIVAGVLIGALNGRLDEVTTAILSECGKAVELAITLMGSMCLWSGIMKIADQGGLTKKISKWFGPILGLLFPRLSRESKAANAITLNLSANLLGLGNAATPLGITAMKELAKSNPHPGTASDEMILFVVLNTASMQLLPTTTAALRQAAGAQSPFDILLPVWLASFVSVVSGILAAKVLALFRPSLPLAKKTSRFPL